MTIQPTNSYNPYAGVFNAPTKPPAQSSQGQAPDTVHLSPQAKASLDVDHDGDSH
jgi:hypothetical protein